MRLFNSGKTDQYAPRGRILEIGPGPAPSVADVYLDISSDYLKKIAGKQVIQGNVNNLPFPDKSFNYCVAMHIAEHIPAAELPRFFTEITRVAEAGYIEVPSIFMELLVNSDSEFLDFGREDVPYDEHQSYWFFDGNTVHIIMKSPSATREKHIIRALFHHVLTKPVLGDNIDLFMIGFGWKNTISYRMYDSLEQIPETLLAAMLKRVEIYAKRKPAPMPLKKTAHHFIDRAFQIFGH